MANIHRLFNDFNKLLTILTKNKNMLSISMLGPDLLIIPFLTWNVHNYLYPHFYPLVFTLLCESFVLRCYLKYSTSLCLVVINGEDRLHIAKKLFHTMIITRRGLFSRNLRETRFQGAMLRFWSSLLKSRQKQFFSFSWTLQSGIKARYLLAVTVNRTTIP